MGWAGRESEDCKHRQQVVPLPSIPANLGTQIRRVRLMLPMADANKTPWVLLLEDETASGQLLHDFLTHQGHMVRWARDGHTALDWLQEAGAVCRLAVLDIMVPGPDGRKVLAGIRNQAATRDLPVLMLTARDQEQDEIQGLAAGADDYLTKPASLHRIQARIQTLLRRHQRSTGAEYSQGSFHMDKDAARAMLEGQPLELTATEWQLLCALVAHPRRVFRREELLDQVTGPSGGDVLERTVDVHIKNLRLKFAARHPQGATLIRTVRGLGYGWNAAWPEDGG